MINKGSFVNGIFLEQFSSKLGKRRKTFRKMFEILEKQQKDNYLIVETGCARADQSWEGDGQSTLMFDSFVRHYGGEVHTVDISESNCAFARSAVSKNTTVHCSDSVDFLWNSKFDRPPDLLYLDSFDLDVNNPHPSARHHIKELLASIRFLSDETLIVIDDNYADGISKGLYVEEFMADIKAEKVFSGYQVAWCLRRERPVITKLSDIVSKYKAVRYVPGISKMVRQHINNKIEQKKLLLLRNNSNHEIASGWNKINELSKKFQGCEIQTVASFDAEGLNILKSDSRIRNIIMFPPTENKRKSWLSWYALTRKNRSDIAIYIINGPPSRIHFKHLISLLFCSGKKYIWRDEKEPQPLASIQGMSFLILTTIAYIESVIENRKK